MPRFTSQQIDDILKTKFLQGERGNKKYIIFAINLFITLPLLIVVGLPVSLLYNLVYVKFFVTKPKRQQASKETETLAPASDRKEKGSRTYDLVLFGATGFTGQLAAKYLTEFYPNLKWAIAGRSESKLQVVRNTLSGINPKAKELPILIADSGNVDQLQKVVNDTRVIISTVGPFAKYGSNLVRLCAQYGTNYTDITGEVAWVRQMIEKYDKVANQTGAILISCAGCDSIPWDILSFKLAQKLKQKHNQALKSVNHYDHMNGNMSGGTFATLRHSLANPPPKSGLGFDPLQKAVGKDEKINVSYKQNIQKFLGYSKQIGKFVGLFVLADGNGCIVRRSNALNGYGDKVLYTEAKVYPNFFAGFNDQVSLLVFGFFISVPPILNLLSGKLFPNPGEGPSQKQMDAGFARIVGFGSGVEGAKVKAEIIFPMDPGYVDTARMVSETGLSMALNHDKLDEKVRQGGYYTPASALGDVLLDRLVESGSQFNYLE